MTHSLPLAISLKKRVIIQYSFLKFLKHKFSIKKKYFFCFNQKKSSTNKILFSNCLIVTFFLTNIFRLFSTFFSKCIYPLYTAYLILNSKSPEYFIFAFRKNITKSTHVYNLLWCSLLFAYLRERKKYTLWLYL